MTQNQKIDNLYTYECHVPFQHYPDATKRDHEHAIECAQLLDLGWMTQAFKECAAHYGIETGPVACSGLETSFGNLIVLCKQKDGYRGYVFHPAIDVNEAHEISLDWQDGFKWFANKMK